MAYMRRFRKLRSVSFKGNPCCDDPMTDAFLKSALPRVTYLDYKTITEQEREDSAVFFRCYFITIKNAIRASYRVLATHRCTNISSKPFRCGVMTNSLATQSVFRGSFSTGPLPLDDRSVLWRSYKTLFSKYLLAISILSHKIGR